jgi:hypothetical protein
VDTPVIRGMLDKVDHLVEVERVGAMQGPGGQR